MIDLYIWIAVWVVILIMFIINLMKIESRLADDRINEMFEYLKKRERENDGRNAEDDNWFCGDGERRTDDDRNG